MKIDTHCHLFSIGLAEAIARNTPYRVHTDQEKKIMTTFLGLNVPMLTEEERIAEMEETGIDTQIISVRTGALITWEELSTSLQSRNLLSQTINDYLATVCQRYSDHFMAYADIPFDAANPDVATHEMIRAVDELGLQGISLLTHYDGKYLDAPEFYSFFEEANHRKIVVFLHPTHPIGKEVLMDYNMYSIVGFPYDTTLAAARMAYSGFLEQFSDITFILSHAGGTIPFIWWRLDMGYSQDYSDYREVMNKPPSDYLKCCYYDTALSDTDSLMLSYQRIGDHLMLGTDHPYSKGGIQRTISAIEAMNLSNKTKAKILGGNALALVRKTQP